MKKIELIRSLEKVLDVFPKRYPLESEKVSMPFFAFGSGRNGSTLFNRMLNQHSQLFAPGEQYFLGMFISRFKLYNYLPWHFLVELIVQTIQKQSRHDWHNLGEIDVSAIANWNESDRSLQQLILAIYDQENNQNKKVWGDSTHLNYHYIPEIYSAFPRAKYIFMIRDGRAVVHSFARAGAVMGDRSNPIIAAKQWMKTISVYERLKSLVDVLVLKYEDLVQDPKCELSRVCEYLGVAYEEQMLQFYKHVPEAAVYQLDIHKGLYHPVFTDSLSKWEEELPIATRNEIVRIMSDGLNKFGYS